MSNQKKNQETKKEQKESHQMIDSANKHFF
jgi:hypothetical protein